MLRGLRLLFIAFWATLFARLRGKPRCAGWSFPFEMVVRYMRLDWEETADWDALALKKDIENRPYPKDFARKVQRKDEHFAGVPGSRFIPPHRAERKGVIVYLHGGSYLFGSSRTTHCELISRLAFETGLEVLAPDFRLLPEHGYPAQLEDALEVYLSILEAGTVAENIVVVGDSSGGNLAIELALTLKERHIPKPCALGLVSPWCDLEMPARSFVENDRYDFGTRAVLLKQARAFAGSLPLSDPRLSPTHADLRGICPCLVIAGELELPRDDIVAFHRKLLQAKVSAELHLAAQMPHCPPAMAALHPEGAASMKRLADFVGEQLARSSVVLAGPTKTESVR